MGKLDILEYFSCLVCAALLIIFLTMSVRTVIGWRRQEFNGNIVPVVIMLTLFNAVIPVIYNIVFLKTLNGSLLSEVSFAVMPFFISVRNRKLMLRVAAVVAVTCIPAYCIRALFIPLHITCCMWMFPVITMVSALAVTGVSVLDMSDRSARLEYTPDFIDVLMERTDRFYLLVFVLLQVIGAVVASVTGWMLTAIILACLAVLVTLFYLMCSRFVSGSVFVLLKDREKQLQESSRTYLCMLSKDNARSDAGYRSIFERLCSYFETEKPFLDPDLSIGSVAKELFTNKAYLSRTINLYTGKNFCQYVNYHRIKYAIALFNSNPGLKVADLAGMSGFRTTTSFSMAFRLYMNETPGEWCKRIKKDKNDS